MNVLFVNIKMLYFYELGPYIYLDIIEVAVISCETKLLMCVIDMSTCLDIYCFSVQRF